MTMRMMCWKVIVRATLVTALVSFGLACGGESVGPTPQVQKPATPVMAPATAAPAQVVETPTEPAPETDAASVPGESRLSSLGARIGSRLPSDVTVDLPAGLNISDGWQQVDLVSPERTAIIRELSWVSDGVTGVEVGMVDWLIWAAIDYEELFDRVVRLDWVSDGVTEQEIQAVKYLFYLAVSDLSFALWLAGQPFLETVEYADVPAVESLLRVYLSAPGQVDLVKALLLTTGGVTDDWAPIVAMTWPVAKFDPNELERLYDPAAVDVHTNLIDLGESGETLLAVVRTEAGAGRTLELVESIVREVEETMGRPLPLGYVGALFGDAVSPGAIGINYGTGMVIEPRFDTADVGDDAEKLRGVLAHEVAHYWWNSNENWVDEGMAEFVAAASYGFPDGRGYPFLRAPCAEARSLSELPPEPRESILCDYSLGQRMFFSLYRALGEEEFYEAARSLYDQSRADLAQKSLFGIPSGVTEAREAFRPEGKVAIDRWYDGKGEYDLDDF